MVAGGDEVNTSSISNLGHVLGVRRVNSRKKPANSASLRPLGAERLGTKKITKPCEIDEIMRRSTAAGQIWRSETIEKRIAIVSRYAELLDQQRSEIAQRITDETGKLLPESQGEVAASIAKVKGAIAAMADRRSDTVVGEADTGQGIRRIRYAPLGVTLVLGPFNFPLHLPGGQIIPSLLSGNTVVFKPSDKSTAVGAAMHQTWIDAGLPTDVLQVIVGGVEIAKHAIDHPDVSAVFLTGSRAAGQSIHRQLAGRPEVLLALELGGNNPIVVDSSASVRSVAQHVSFSAFISSGQRCTCARRAIFIEGEKGDRQIEALIEQTRSLTVGMPDDVTASQLGPLVDADAVATLNRTHSQLLDLGCTPVVPFKIDANHQSLVSPAIVDATEISRDRFKQMGEMEWFGPLLVIARASDLSEAFTLAAATPYGLAASLLGGDHVDFETFASVVRSGVVNWNGPTTGAAGNLPFGGQGWSGNHRPAGYFAIDFCNEPVAQIEKPCLSDQDLWSPP